MSEKKRFLDNKGVETFAKSFFEKVNELIDGNIMTIDIEEDDKGGEEDDE